MKNPPPVICIVNHALVSLTKNSRQFAQFADKKFLIPSVPSCPKLTSSFSYLPSVKSHLGGMFSGLII